MLQKNWSKQTKSTELRTVVVLVHLVVNRKTGQR